MNSTNNRLTALSIASSEEENCPAAEQLAAYILGELSGNEQLRIAAHVRSCPFCQHDMAVSRPPAPRRRVFARLLPLAFAEGRRGGSGDVQRYVAGETTIDLTIIGMGADSWRLSGQISRAGEPLPGRSVTLRYGRKRFYEMSDETGFFSLRDLPEGRYTLTLDDSEAPILVRGLALGEHIA
jgi:hypothetical protein